MNEENLSAIEIYMGRVFQLVILLFPASTLASGIFCTVMKFALHYYPAVSWPMLLIFDFTSLCYMIGGILILLKSETPDGYLKANSIKHGKIYVAVLELVQWNFMSYLLSGSESTMFYAYFLILIVFFLDHRFVLIMIAGLSLSTLAQWLFFGRLFLPARDEFFLPNIVLRIIFISLSSFCLWLVTYFVQKRLAHELEKLADYDALTLLHNRRSMKTHINSVMKQAEKGEGTFTLLMCDLDNFKRINDTYGHDCGDLILKTVANIISCAVRKDDVVFRYGGEEILVMVRADKEITGRVAERIRSDVANEKISYNDSDVNITLTIGVASYQPNSTVEDLIKLADSRLYIGKNNGKNQVVNG